MNISEAVIKTNFLENNAVLRSNIISLLVTGELEICDNCGFTMTPGTMCEICENEWADQMAAQEEEYSWGRADMLAGKF